LRTSRKLGARIASLVSVGALVATGTVVATTTAAHAKKTPTDFGLVANSYGTRIVSNDIALASGRTAYAWVSCTKMAGLNPANTPTAGNYLASTATPDGLVDIGAVTSTTRTYRKKAQGIVGSEAVNRLASVTLAGPETPEGLPGPVFTLEGLTTKARAWAKDGRFHAATDLGSAELQLDLPEGTPVDAELDALLGALNGGIAEVVEVIGDTAGDQVDVPGLGTIKVGHERTTVRRSHASASAFALLVELVGADGVKGTDDDSRVMLGRSRARINRDLPAGVMNGYGYAFNVRALDGVANIGRVGMQVLPCQGTDGEVREFRVPPKAGLLGGALDLGSLNGKAYGIQRKDGTAEAWTQGRVSDLRLLGDDQVLEIHDIVATARVKQRESGRLVRSARGTSIGSVTLNGETLSSRELLEPLFVEGLGKVEFLEKKVSTRGLKVTAVRITLDPGGLSETVVNLGNARTFLTRY
jgi:hypothetical protein